MGCEYNGGKAWVLKTRGMAYVSLPNLGKEPMEQGTRRAHEVSVMETEARSVLRRMLGKSLQKT